MKKNIVIAGASGLIGSEIYDFLSSNGHNVINLDVNNSQNKLNYYRTNALNVKDVSRSIKILKKKFKKIDVLINCIYPKRNKEKNFFKIKLDVFIKELTIHVGAYFNINQQFAKLFKKQKSGHIINFSSIYSDFLPRLEIYKNLKINMPIYYRINKNFVVSLTQYIAKFLKKFGVRANCVSPGGVYNKHPLLFVKRYGKYTMSNKMLNRNDLNGIINFLISDSSKNITGQDFIIDDGFIL